MLGRQQSMRRGQCHMAPVFGWPVLQTPTQMHYTAHIYRYMSKPVHCFSSDFTLVLGGVCRVPHNLSTSTGVHSVPHKLEHSIFAVTHTS